nr:MAG TPA: hypothetical protein [Caudoviricetes sp.]
MDHIKVVEIRHESSGIPQLYWKVLVIVCSNLISISVFVKFVF